MTEKENIQFVSLLTKFVDTCGLDQIDACKQAQKLLTMLNDGIPEERLSEQQVEKIIDYFKCNNIIFADDEEPFVKENTKWTLQQVDDVFVREGLLELEF